MLSLISEHRGRRKSFIRLACFKYFLKKHYMSGISILFENGIFFLFTLKKGIQADSNLNEKKVLKTPSLFNIFKESV
jgi:hypothetical protein